MKPYKLSQALLLSCLVSTVQAIRYSITPSGQSLDNKGQTAPNQNQSFVERFESVLPSKPPHLCVCTINQEDKLPKSPISSECGGDAVPIFLAVQDCQACQSQAQSISIHDEEFTLVEQLKVTKDNVHKGIPAIFAMNAPAPKMTGMMTSDVTSSTVKGSVWANVSVSGRDVTIVTSHGTEGIRCKAGTTGKKASQGTDCRHKSVNGTVGDGKCPRGSKPDSMGKGKYTSYEAEIQRVKHFRAMAEKLKGWPHVVWGMDMNTRRVEKITGVDNGYCPAFELKGAKEVDDTSDFLGDGNLAKEVMRGFDWAKSPCPTYQKRAKGRILPDCGSYNNDAEKPKPISYVDRVYTKGAVAEARNVPRDDDHDIVCARVTLAI